MEHLILQTLGAVLQRELDPVVQGRVLVHLEDGLGDLVVQHPHLEETVSRVLFFLAYQFCIGEEHPYPQHTLGHLN